MSEDKLELQDLNFSFGDADAIAAKAWAFAERGEGCQILTLNPELFELARRNVRYADVVGRSDIVTADGIGICLALAARGFEAPPRISGVELARAFVRLSARTGTPLRVIGASEPFRRRFEQVAVSEGATILPGASPSYGADQHDFPDLAECVSVPQILLLALGAPKQEYAGSYLRDRGAVGVFIGVGGAIDILSRPTNAPREWSERLGVHWLYRLLTEPSVRLRRQARSLPPFLAREILAPLARRR